MTSVLTAILAEDSVLLRDGLLRLLERSKIDVVATCGDGESLVAAVRQQQPGIVITDVRMPPTNTSEGVRAALRIRAEYPQQPIMVLSQYVEEEYAVELISAPHGIGYLLKDRVADTKDFIAALRSVAAGGTALDPEVVGQLFARSRQQNPLAQLSAREAEVLELMAQGQTNAAIAASCFISASSVEKHISAIFNKLNLPPEDGQHRRVLAVLKWLNHR